jgi:uridylate kinase
MAVIEDFLADAKRRMDRSIEATLFPELPHHEAIERGLKGMATTALSHCLDNRLPILVFGLEEGNIQRVVRGEHVGTIISTPRVEEGKP